ncbi:MAG: SoxR reducing system RseC family protein [Planctomycetota bacterium]|jgi:hypothetical protein
MNEQDFCKSCNQKDNCQEVYERLGKAEGPSVVFKVVIAFLLPLVVFTVSIAVFELILARAMNAKGLQTALSVLLAVSATFACILLIRRISGRVSKEK